MRRVVVGDYYELLVFHEGDPTRLAAQLAELRDFEFIEDHHSNSVSFVELKSAVDFDSDFFKYHRCD